MDAIRVQNLRSLEDTGWVDLKPLTLLIGNNNSGKSTFLRCFPLFRQSVESRIVGPILWYGDYVDFGSFQEAVRNGSDDLSFHFQFRTNLNVISPLLNRLQQTLSKNFYDFRVSIVISGSETDQTTYIEYCTLEFEREHIVKIEFKNNKIHKYTINDQNYLKYIEVDDFKITGDFLPIIYPKSTSRLPGDSPFHISPNDPLFQFVKQKLNNNKITEETILNLINRFTIGTSEQMLRDVKNLQGVSKKWSNITETWTEKNEDFIELCNLILNRYIPYLFINSNQQLNLFSSNIAYIAPARASLERFQRIQNFTFVEVDSKGRNLSVVLASLSPQQFEQYNNWLIKYFDFEIKLEIERGQVSLKLKRSDSKVFYNIADTGFGFSEILPVITQLWLLINGTNNRRARNRNTPMFFVVEQPELHLHPELQARLAYAFVITIQEARAKNRDLRLIIETHSETIVNKLGQLIDDKQVDNNDINVVVFDKRYPDEPTKVTFSHYNEEGYLVNWPWGFFEPEGLA